MIEKGSGITKRGCSFLLAIVLSALLFAACAADHTPPSYPDSHTLYYKDSKKSAKAVATFFNSDSGESDAVEMEKNDEDGGSVTFSCEGDCSRYNMVSVACDGENVTVFSKLAFNPCVSGWYRTEDDLLPYTVGEEINYVHDYQTITLNGFGEDKKIHIWTPDDYDDSSDEKYATVYVLDGQGFVYLGENDQKLKGCPVVNEQVRAMSAATGQKAIVVAIESDVERNYEMVPEIGESMDEKYFKMDHDTEFADEFDGMNGSELAQFIAETLAPYVREHYNVYPDALHTSITGASLGGLECFYTAVEYPDVFGSCGAMSPSFWEFDDDVWNSYLGEKNFGSDAPVLYFYAGPREKGDTGTETAAMADRLKGMGYPGEKLILHLNDEGMHDSTLWRNVYSEFLTAMVFRGVKPLQNAGEAVSTE